MATIVASAGGGNWNSTSSWVGGVFPTASDDVQLTSASGPITINVASACRSLDCTGYTGTLTHNAFTLSIGDSTAGNLSQALKLVAGMTYSPVSASALMLYVSTSATQQTVDYGGKTMGSQQFQGSGGSWILASAYTSVLGSITCSAGSFNTGNFAITCASFNAATSTAKSVTLGSSAISVSGNLGYVSTGMTLSAGTSVITFTGSPSINGAGLTWYDIVMTGPGCTFIGASTFRNCTHTGTAVKTNSITLQANQTFTGTFTVNGNSTVNRVLILADIVGTSRTITAAAVSFSNVDFQDITGAGAASWNLSAITGLSGDCGGNSGITFTTPTTQTHSGTSTSSASTAGSWTSRTPLPQDDVVISTTGGSFSLDMPRMGKNIDMSGSSGPITMSVQASAYGNVKLPSINFTGSTFTLLGRGAQTITSNGSSFVNLQISGAGGTYTLLDNLSCGSNALSLLAGTFDSGNFAITASAMSLQNSSVTRSLVLGTSTVTLTGVGTVWNSNTTALSVSAASSTVLLAGSVSASTRTFVGSGFTYGTLSYVLSGSTGGLTITGNNTFANINFSDASNARTLTLTGTTQTITGSINGIVGTASKLMSVTGGTISKSSGIVSCDYLSLTSSTASGGAAFYAGANSTNVSGNSGWIFTAPPATNSPRLLLMGIG